MPESSKIFEGYRALGLYSSHIPHCTRYHKKHKEHYIFVIVGKVFHSYNCSKLGITQVSNSHPEDISCITADAFLVYTGCGKTVRAFQHNRQVKYTYDGHKDNVHLILPFSEHLISVDESSSVKIWHIRSQELYLEIEFSNATFQITAIMHPSTYVNKILIGSRQGKLQLWNIRKNEMLYEFHDQEESFPVVCIVQAPAVDVVAIGRANGDVCIHNIRVDQRIMKFHQDSGPVIGIAFRTDGASTMVTSSPRGHIAVWDLDEKQLIGIMETVHTTAIAGMTFIHGQPLLVTNAADNTIKMWAFDQSDGKGRLLRMRAGHSAPPIKIKFYDDDGENILTTGLDSTMQSFSTVHEEKNKSLGQASMNRALARKKSVRLDERKLPPIIDFCSQTARSREWDNIIAYHSRHHVATTWNYQNSRMGSHKLLPDRFRYKAQYEKENRKGSRKMPYENLYVSSVAMTECGNFCLVGYSTGHVDLFNIQSGIHRGSYIDKKLQPKDTAHNKTVTGIDVDALNQVTVTISLDKTIKFWRFKSKELLECINLESSAARSNLHRGSAMYAVALDNFSLKIFDLDTRKLVRYFPGHLGVITDLTWSSNSRWLISSAMDCTIKTWELPTDSLIDCFLVDNAAVTVSMSPTSELLASCHVDDLGIYLWSNRAIFNRISLQPLPRDFHPVDLTELPGTVVMKYEERDVVEIDAEPEPISEYQSPEQLVENFITLSNLPHSRWANLLSLDVIKRRNKPKEPPIVPKSAPFFLPTIAGLKPTLAVNNEDEKSKIIECTVVKPLSEFASVLQECDAKLDYNTFMESLKEMGPSEIDIEIRCLSPEGGGSVELMRSFLSFILYMLESKKNFELIQAYLGLFLKVHTEYIASEAELLPLIQDIRTKHNETWAEARKMFDQCICLVNFIKTATL